ncbi:hypothetical protein [Acinetobacter entericus]|uniref:Uncharacterized protein n=1 Tax=Acinetobacter entericus TaxID=2989714 RepID=A0ABT3NEK5_9GAMM|nr:hypothetical protein [Acinetobacter entericus]MCW8037952.1 hypothetical protein [Acinetobacter entericus]
MNQAQIKRALAKDFSDENFDMTEDGIYFPNHGIVASGIYIDRTNGGEWEQTSNLVTKEGRIAALDTYFGTKVKPSGLYLALFNGAAAPAANWTAANFAATAGEIVSLTEGFNSATRPAYTPADATDQEYIDNFSSVARITIVTSNELTVTGAAVLTSSARGGTTGVLVSAAKFAAARTFQNGDIYELGYRISFTS